MREFQVRRQDKGEIKKKLINFKKDGVWQSRAGARPRHYFSIVLVKDTRARAPKHERGSLDPPLSLSLYEYRYITCIRDMYILSRYQEHRDARDRRHSDKNNVHSHVPFYSQRFRLLFILFSSQFFFVPALPAFAPLPALPFSHLRAELFDKNATYPEVIDRHPRVYFRQWWWRRRSQKFIFSFKWVGVRYVRACLFQKEKKRERESADTRPFLKLTLVRRARDRGPESSFTTRIFPHDLLFLVHMYMRTQQLRFNIAH